MTVTLRDYQREMVVGVRDAFVAGDRSVLLQLPTGGGKTITSGFIMGATSSKGNRCGFICNRIELVKQTMKTLDRLGIRYGVICAGFTPDPRAMVQVCSIDTLKGRLAKLPADYFKLLVWDECRSIAAAGWARVKAHFHKAMHLGLDATPIRLDGTGLGNFFSRMICGPSYSDLMRRGALVPFRCFAPTPAPDMDAMGMEKGDVNKAAAEAAMDKPSIVGDIVDSYRQFARGKKGLTFAVSRKASEHLAAAYRAAGVRAVHIDGDEDKGVRDRAVKGFARGEIDVICNVDLFTAGFDVPGIEVVQMARPTKSLAVFLQQAGRGSRPDENNPDKRDCILLDHVGNLLEHGFPDDDRTWTLDAKARKKKKKKDEEDEDKIKVAICETCFRSYRLPASACPDGHPRTIGGRSVAEIEGELAEVTRAELERMRADAEAKKNARIEVGMAGSLEALEKIGRDRGYSPGWAKNIWRARGARGSAKAEAQFAAYARR